MAYSSITFSNGKSTMRTSEGVYSVGSNNTIVFTPNNNFSYPNGVSYSVSSLSIDLDKLIIEPNDEELKNKVIDGLTNDPEEQIYIVKFVESFPDYYSYFEPIVLGNDNSSIIYEWMISYDLYKEKNYIKALLNSLNNPNNIITHERFLCNVIHNRKNYHNASDLEVQVKILALQIYDIDEFLHDFKNSYDYCIDYDNLADDEIVKVSDDHYKLHDNIVNSFYDNLPKEYQLGVVL